MQIDKLKFSKQTSIDNMASLYCFAVLFALANSALSAKIAGFSFASSGSHYFVIRTVMEELASRGHEVNLINLKQCTMQRLYDAKKQKSILY